MTLVGEHEANKENTEPAVGEVSLLKQEEVVDDEGRLYYRRFVKVGDESDADPELREIYRARGDQLDQEIQDHPEWKKTTINQKTREVTVDPHNTAARWLYYDQDGNETQMVDWAGDFPSAIALEPLQRLEKGGGLLTDGKLDNRTLELMTYMEDAIGIRSRAHIYAQRLVELSGSVDGPLNIISVGSGAAVPNIEATLRVEQEQGKYINWHFYDTSPRALARAHQLVEEADFERSSVNYGPVSLHPENGWEFQGRSFVEAYAAEREAFDVVDALGLWEYLPDRVAQKFAQTLYSKVKPGGMMIVSNMLEGRPQQALNEIGVGWPHLVRRTEEDLLNVLEMSGIPSQNVTMTHAEDGIYVVMEIQKPIVMEIQ